MNLDKYIGNRRIEANRKRGDAIALIYAEGDEVAVMVNGMGATPLSELFIANLRVKEILDEKKISIAKTLVGNYMTSLDMAGFSVTLLKLDDELKGFLNAPADTPAYKEV